MARSTTPQEISRRESFGSWVLWFAVLGGPAAWITHLIVGYSLEEWFACSPSVTDAGEILGIGVRTVAMIITIAMGLLAFAAGVASVSCLRKIRNADGTDARRARWMAIAGLMNSVLYFLIIVGGVAPALILNVCENSP